MDNRNTTFDNIYNENPDLETGGVWRPRDCTATSKIALIIPLIDREEHLKIFLRNIIPFLRNQKIEFAIFVVEQVSKFYYFIYHSLQSLINIFVFKICVVNIN